MRERRPLVAALDLPADKLAFIKGGVPEPAVETAAPTQMSSADAQDNEAEEGASPKARVPRSPRRSRSRGQLPASVNERDSAFLGLANLLIPLTTRLQPVTAAALKRAGLEQKLRGQHPATVQKIAEEAIQNWLRDYGYLE